MKTAQLKKIIEVWYCDYGNNFRRDYQTAESIKDALNICKNLLKAKCTGIVVDVTYYNDNEIIEDLSISYHFSEYDKKLHRI